MLSGHYRYVLIAYNHQEWLFATTAIAAAAAVILGFALEPFYGGPGAAWALLIANSLHFVLVYIAVRRLITPIPLYRQIRAPLISLALAIALTLTMQNWFSLWLALTAGCIVYVTGMLVSDGSRLAGFAGSITRKQQI